MAVCQVPLVLVTTNTWKWPALSLYWPSALQFPAERHDTEVTAAPLTPAPPPWLRAPLPGTSLAVAQVPPVWVTANASWRKLAPPAVYHPPALQLPADAHDTEVTLAFPPALSAAVPGTSLA